MSRESLDVKHKPVNLSIPQPINLSTTTLLPVMEHFYTLQGEGYHQGKAAYFIRLGGCDVGCTWCDVKDSWDSGRHPLRKISDLVKEVKNTPAKMVVITGGEPPD